MPYACGGLSVPLQALFLSLGLFYGTMKFYQREIILRGRWIESVIACLQENCRLVAIEAEPEQADVLRVDAVELGQDVAKFFEGLPIVGLQSGGFGSAPDFIGGRKIWKWTVRGWQLGFFHLENVRV